MIKIKLNGKEQEIQRGISVSDLLLKWKIRPELVTVEINEVILQKLDYDSSIIQDGDNVEFVFYMGGGAERSQLAARGFRQDHIFERLSAASCQLPAEINGK